MTDARDQPAAAKQSIRVHDARTIWFEALINIGEFGSYAAAARVMTVDEKSVRGYIRDFEKWICFDLVAKNGDKTKSPLHLTTRARRMIGHLQDFLEFIDRSRSSVTLEDLLIAKTQQSGSFNITGKAIRDANGEISIFEVD